MVMSKRRGLAASTRRASKKGQSVQPDSRFQTAVNCGQFPVYLAGFDRNHSCGECRLTRITGELNIHNRMNCSSMCETAWKEFAQ